VSDKERLMAVKRHLRTLVKRGKRHVPFDLPTKWWPGGVSDPRTGVSFTPAGAWDFIAEQLGETGTMISEIELNEPAGRKGYVLQVHTKSQTIYIKIHFGGTGNTVIGRSFHYSNQ